MKNAAMGIPGGILRIWPPIWDPARWDWSRTAQSLGLCQRYATLTPEQQVLHDAEAIHAPLDLQRLMPVATRTRIIQQSFRDAIAGLRGAL